MDDEFEWDRDEIVDLDGYWADVTGDPALDRTGYQSPRRTGNLTGFTPHKVNQDWLAQSKKDREQRAAKRQGARREATQPAVGSEEWRARRAARWEALGWLTPANGSCGEERHEQNSSVQTQPVQTPQQQRDEIAAKSLTELQPGQHGCFMEHREARCWWAPWRKRMVWRQVSAWMSTTPPKSGVNVITVGDISELPGKVHTIGDVDPQTGAVEY